MSGNPPVVIIGAGVGGLTLALLLRRRGIVAEVLEQSTELREVGAAVGLAANATRVLQHLGLGEALAKVSTEPTGLIHRDGRDGHRIAATRGPQWYRDTFGAPFFGLHRAALQRLLADALGGEHLHLGCHAAALEQRDAGMRVRCSSGGAFDAGLVVGADGAHSLVRDWVTGGDEPVYSGTSGFRGLVPVERLHAAARSRRSSVLDGARRAPAALPDQRRQRDQLPRGNRHQGQGANQTIEDAVVLAAELDSASDIPAALRRYARRRRVRTRQVQLASWAASAALHLPDGQAAQRRNAYLAQIPQHIAWIHSYDALAQDRDDLARTTGAR